MDVKNVFKRIIIHHFQEISKPKYFKNTIKFGFDWTRLWRFIPTYSNEFLTQISTHSFWNIMYLSASKSDMSIFFPNSFTFGCFFDINQPTWLKKKPRFALWGSASVSEYLWCWRWSRTQTYKQFWWNKNKTILYYKNCESTSFIAVLDNLSRIRNQFVKLKKQLNWYLPGQQVCATKVGIFSMGFLPWMSDETKVDEHPWWHPIQSHKAMQVLNEAKMQISFFLEFLYIFFRVLHDLFSCGNNK